MMLFEAPLDARGVHGDRSFALLDVEGRALTQRDAPLLATIGTRLAGERLELELGGLDHMALEGAAFRETRRAIVWGRARGAAPSRLPRSRRAWTSFLAGTAASRAPECCESATP